VETYEGTPAIKSPKLYTLKDKLTSFKMKDDKNIPEMFHRLQVTVNDLKALDKKINDDDVSHWFLMCLSPRVETLKLIIIREGLKQLTPNQVLSDVMTQETYRVKREGVDQDEKKDEEKNKKSVAFKTSTSSKNEGKSKKEESSEDEDASDIDDKAMALFVRKFGKFMKKGYGARKRRDSNKDYVRRCYKCKSKDHIMVDYPYNSDSDKNDKKKVKKEKEKKEKR
jgi:hypothetical protein